LGLRRSLEVPMAGPALAHVEATAVHAHGRSFEPGLMTMLRSSEEGDGS
jgi:hypothetical protein